MPRGNGTGPEGKGPKTGRGKGPCGTKSSHQTGQRPGRGVGQGNRQVRKGGLGRGRSKQG